MSGPIERHQTVVAGRRLNLDRLRIFRH
jgi:hypothetical protein